jgi:hypothetical protein
VAEHAEAIEADMLRYYRLDLARDLGTERLTYRRLLVLIRQLPRDSAYWQEVGGERYRWGTAEHLLANIADALLVHDWHYMTAHSKRRPPPPTLTRRPGVEPDDGKDRTTYGKGQSFTVDELRAIFDGAAARKAAEAAEAVAAETALDVAEPELVDDLPASPDGD